MATKFTHSIKPAEWICTGCKTNVTNVLHKSAVVISCPKCFKYFTSEQGFGYKLKHEFKTGFTPDIPLHTTCNYKGISYQVVGFAIRREIGGAYDWREYTLYNPIDGIAVLSEYDGNWLFTKNISNYPRVVVPNDKSVIDFEGLSYQKFNRYRATVKFACGEFSYDIFNDKQKTITEWICPPYMLIRERDDFEVVWSMGQSLSPNEVKALFKLDKLPEKIGIGAAQEMRFNVDLKFTLITTFILLLAMLIVQNVGYTGATEKKVFDWTYKAMDIDTTGVIVGQQFEVTGTGTALQFDVYAPITNDWFDLDFELINETTGDRFEGAKSLEFYEGYDSEGKWTEGSKGDYIIISSVPPGKYHINFYPQFSSGHPPDASFRVKVFQGVTLWANFTVFILLALVFPLVHYIRLNAFELRRWENSNYSPTLPTLHF